MLPTLQFIGTIGIHIPCDAAYRRGSQFRPAIAVCVLMAFTLFYSFYNEMFALWLIAAIAGTILVIVPEDIQSLPRLISFLTALIISASKAGSILVHAQGLDESR